MAGFRTHVGVAATIGVGYGYLMHKGVGCHWESGVLCATLTAVGGMLPDLDSDTGRPVDLLELDDGSLLLSDDVAGVIYRISYRPAS